MSEHLPGHSFLFTIKYLTLESHSNVNRTNVKIFVVGTSESYRSDRKLYEIKILQYISLKFSFAFRGKAKRYEEIELLSFAARDSRSPSARKSLQREKRAFPHYSAEGEGGKEIARNACEKVQSRILHLAFRVSKRHLIEKSESCAIAFSRERAR